MTSPGRFLGPIRQFEQCSHSIAIFAVDYGSAELEEQPGRCDMCACCDECTHECGCEGGSDETEDEMVRRVLGITVDIDICRAIAGPMDFSRQDVLDFDASSYNDTLREVAPLITSTVTAACSRGTQVNILTETGLTQSGHPALRRSRPRRAWVGLAGNSTSSQSSIRPSAGSSS